ncbi:helix-turn-helix domain-containing protein [Candidatus Microthrix parvicella]|jgi:hypothetical protein|uniref:Putative DNA binding domain-containing protein n=1 Tax=Candidatus Neomicrothrix parvicella RN1 TaxID=1229780 RepID=R4Z3K3_9ACTN|nr:putative DNA binding domain-containing protein [Candidatus Microthrix parvicella RN1]
MPHPMFFPLDNTIRTTDALFLTVEEAAQALRISRTLAYQEVNRYLDTDGAHGLAAVRVGRAIRVPQSAIDRLASGAC